MAIPFCLHAVIQKSIVKHDQLYFLQLPPTKFVPIIGKMYKFQGAFKQLVNEKIKVENVYIFIGITLTSNVYKEVKAYTNGMSVYDTLPLKRRSHHAAFLIAPCALRQGKLLA